MSDLLVVDSIRMLLSAIVDYAGLFPPAQLDLQRAIATYVQHQATSEQWMLGRFVLPAAQCDDFADQIATLPDQTWFLSGVVSQNVDADLERMFALKDDRITIAALEFPYLPLAEIDRLCDSLPTGLEAFFEISSDPAINPDLETYLETLQRRKVFAKVRTGGITPNAFPDSLQLSRFIAACAQIHLPFKATAGLHHPLRSQHPVTYQSNSPIATMHGFLNVAIAAALMYWQKITLTELQFLLEETTLNSLQFQPDGLVWCTPHSEYCLTLKELQDARQKFFRSFGSCSFDEPLHDLKTLHLL